jgi:hypothetical protein
MSMADLPVGSQEGFDDVELSRHFWLLTNDFETNSFDFFA